MYAIRSYYAIKRADANPLGAADVVVVTGYRETPLLHLFKSVIEYRIFGIDQGQGLGVVFGQVDRHDALVGIDLSGCQADTGRVVHGFEHVVDQRTNGVVDLGDRFGDGTEARIGEFEYSYNFV